MFKVFVGNNVDRWSVMVTPDTTLRALLEQEQIDYTRGTMHLDGVSLRPGDLDKTFAEIGVTSECYLLMIKKVDNA